MAEWNGRPPSADGSPSAHILRDKLTGIEFPAIWYDAEWDEAYGPVYAAKYYAYVGPLLTPAEVRDRELAAFEAGAKSMRTTIETAVRLAASQEEERIYAERPQPHSARAEGDTP